jgi:hypothetical protein
LRVKSLAPTLPRFVRLLTLLFAIGLATLPSAARASTICDYYRQDFPDLYKTMCSNGSADSKPAGANSTFSDAFNINSASLPTEPSSYGLETIGSYLRNDPGTQSPTFSLIKGFHRFGTGISTAGVDTFYGNDVVQRGTGAPLVTSFSPTEPAEGHISNLNLGTSILLTNENSVPTLRLGLSARYNEVTNTWGGGPGLMMSWSALTFGAGFTKEKVSNTLPAIDFTSFMASVRISFLEFEYTLMQNYGGYDLEPIQIVSATAELDRVQITAAVRHLNYLTTGDVVQTHLALQYMFSKYFSVGYLYNYIPGANSLGVQIFL